MSGKLSASVSVLVCYIAFSTFMVSSVKAFEPESILGVWLFDEEKGDEILDSSEKGHNGKLTNVNIARVDGKFGDALEFLGGGKVVIPHTEEFILSTFTLMAWIKVDKFNDKYQLIVGKDGWPDRNYCIYVRKDTGVVHYSFGTAAQENAGNMNSNKLVSDGEWHHIAATYDLKVRRIYIDGVLDLEKQLTMELPKNAIDVEIGRNLTGLIDEVLIANEAFELDDIMKAMEVGLKEFIGGGRSVSASGKLASTWGAMRSEAVK